MKPRAIAAVSAGIVLAAAVVGWVRPIELPVGSVAGGSGAWRLPAGADLERSTAAQYAAIRGVAWVGMQGSAGPGGAASEWTLLGLVGRPDDRAALVRVGKDPLIKRFSAGDTLPDGSRLVEVGSSGIAIDRDGCRIRRALYPSPEDAATTADACTTPGND